MTGEQLSLLDDTWPAAPRSGTRRGTPPALDAEQLTFDWSLPVALGPESFFVSESNADAHAMITGGLRWPEGRLLLVGPEGAGKSHLVRIWQTQTGAVRLAARDLSAAPALPEPGAAVAVEDMEALPAAAEQAMFHLHNYLLQTGGRLLMTADRPAAQWRIGLSDLASRMQAAHVVRIGPPDDALLAALLAKHFADRGIFPHPDVMAFLVRRIERSHAAAAAAVALLDRASLAEGCRVTLALARRIVDSGETPGP
ncbi:DnaA ATPase domain-containing protein [Rubellimicrobium sp. CFH 75288]|uniref:HdaA/DnaA family protein n=1 Tax=Rubellimicrobium sp. CFH 75288 TaxID=2697034 RepID=UPI0014130869|nr:DnaA/Hda family protein [Rubellimicrobium sp. CFH 75288]NAZ35912.1 chromosomal replication initiator DnaA [Rubellimicrobium sp. CFH 75288]